MAPWHGWGVDSEVLSPTSRNWARCRKGNPPPRPPTKMQLTFWCAMVHEYPHEVTIYEGGPMTNLALAILDRSRILPAWPKNWCSWAAV